jgi:hypothetical protein
MLSYTNVILGNDTSISILQQQLQDIAIDNFEIDNSGINDNSISILPEQLHYITGHGD